MKKQIIIAMLCAFATSARAQTINAAYVKALYQRYPTLPSDFCAACKVWVNPYYKSIADTARHMPLVTYYVYTKAHRIQQENADVPEPVFMPPGMLLTANLTKQKSISKRMWNHLT